LSDDQGDNRAGLRLGLGSTIKTDLKTTVTRSSQNEADVTVSPCPKFSVLNTAKTTYRR